MRKTWLMLAFLAPLCAVSAAPRGQTAAPDPLAGRVAGAPRQCITLRPQLDSDVAGGRIIYKPSRATWYVNTPDCAGLLDRRDLAIATVTPGTSLCRGDIVRVFDPSTAVVYGSCGLSDFVPYTRADKAQR